MPSTRIQFVDATIEASFLGQNSSCRACTFAPRHSSPRSLAIDEAGLVFIQCEDALRPPSPERMTRAAGNGLTRMVGEECPAPSMLGTSHEGPLPRRPRLDPHSRAVHRALRREHRLRRGAARRRHGADPRRRDRAARAGQHADERGAQGAHSTCSSRTCTGITSWGSRSSSRFGRRGRTSQIHPLANETQQAAARTRTLFDGIHFPVRAADVPGTIEFLETRGDPWRIGSATHPAHPLNHPGGAQGFRIDDDGGASLAYITDNELSPPAGSAATSIGGAREVRRRGEPRHPRRAVRRERHAREARLGALDARRRAAAREEGVDAAPRALSPRSRARRRRHRRHRRRAPPSGSPSTRRIRGRPPRARGRCSISSGRTLARAGRRASARSRRATLGGAEGRRRAAARSRRRARPRRSRRLEDRRRSSASSARSAPPRSVTRRQPDVRALRPRRARARSSASGGIPGSRRCAASSSRPTRRDGIRSSLDGGRGVRRVARFERNARDLPGLRDSRGPPRRGAERLERHRVDCSSAPSPAPPPGARNAGL